MRRSARSVWVARSAWAFFLLARPAVASADEVYFTSGKVLKGLVVEEHADRLVVSTVAGERVVPRREVDEVFFDDPERNYLYLGNEAMDRGDWDTALALFQRAGQLHPAWPEARWAFRRLEDEQRKRALGWLAPPDPLRSLWEAWGIRLAETDAYPVVEGLSPRGLARVRGGVALRVGDRIVSVWKKSAGFRPAFEVAGHLLGPPGTQVALTIQREVVIQPSDGAPEALPDGALSMGEEGLAVASGRLPEVAAELRAGDRIVAVEQRATRYLSLAASRARMAEAYRKGEVRVTLERDVFLTRPS